MTRFPIIAEEDVNDTEVAQVYAEIRQELGLGIVPNIFKSMAIRPTLLRTNWDKFRATILQGYLPRTLKEMIGVLVSQNNNSEYAMRVHMHGLSVLGMSDEVLQSLITDFEHCPLPEREKTILRFALLVATDPNAITNIEYDTLHDYDLSDKEIFEIIATADLFTSVNAYTDSIDLEIDRLA